MGALDFLKHYTYEDYKLWEGKWELYEGFPVAMSPAPIITHQAIAAMFISQINTQLDECLRCFVLGEEDYKVSEDTILRPDVVLICDEPHDKYITKAPEIIIEVSSPSTAKNDETYKLQKYEEEQVLYYVLAYPSELRAKVYKRTEGKYQKVGDFSKESYHFEETLCSVKIDFEKIFRRFQK